MHPTAGLDLNPVKSSIYSVSSTDPASPLQRQSLWHILARTFWIPADPTASLAVNVTQAFHDAHNSVEVLRDMAPDSGADVNEPDPLEPDPITTIWGQENYDRLLRIKQKIDPNNIIPAYDV